MFFADRPVLLVAAAVVLLLIPLVWATALTASRGYTGSYGALLVLFTSPVPFAAYAAVYMAHRWTLDPPPTATGGGTSPVAPRPTLLS